MEWLWLLAAVGHSLLTAQNVEMNRRAKQEGFRLNMWRMGLSSIFWLPLALVQEWPQDWGLYLAAIFSGLAMIIGFTIQTSLAVKHNGRVAILHVPLKAATVFIVWALVNTAARDHMVEHWTTVAGVFVCLIVMVLALFSFRRNDVSWQGFKAILPIVVLYALGDIFCRMTLEPAHLKDQLIVFLFVMTLASTAFSLLLLRWRPEPSLPLITPTLLKAGGWAAFGGTLNQVCFFLALILGPSPAYVSMVALLAPVWLLIYHRVAHIRDDASPVAGTVVVIAAIMLMVMAA